MPHVSQGSTPFDLASFADRVLRGPRETPPESPLDAAAARLEQLVPGHTHHWYMAEALHMVKVDRPDRSPIDRVVVLAYRRRQNDIRAGVVA